MKRRISQQVLGLPCTCYETEELEVTCSNCVLAEMLLREKHEKEAEKAALDANSRKAHEGP